MAGEVTERGAAEAGAGDAAVLQRAIEAAPGVFGTLATVRSRRVGAGYRVDSGAEEAHPVTGRAMRQGAGPHAFVSELEPQPLALWEEALLAWAACGPNGLVAWDVSMDGGFNQIVSALGRTAPEPNNTLATDLVIVSDGGTWLYRPAPELTGPAIAGTDPARLAEQVLEWYRDGRTRLLDGRPDVDWAMREPGAPNAPLHGPHQFNMNRPGSVWLLPVTDAGSLGSGMVDLFATRHAYLVDDFADGRPAGLEEFVGEGQLERPVPLSAYEQGVLTNEIYPAGCVVQNVRLAAEALGLGTWAFSGHDAAILFGARPELARGLGFEVAERNPRAPVAAGALKVFGKPGVKEATFVPSPRFRSPAALVSHWYDQRHGRGAWASPGADNPIAAGRTAWREDRAEQIAGHPLAEPPSWAWRAAERHIAYCVERYGQWPVSFNPMQAGFGVTVHHVDTAFYDRHYRPGLVTPAIREHHRRWHDHVRIPRDGERPS
ncbi:MAG TPA: hypothetical protein VGW75_12460 [Solirubrobacteraceae bacterium]|jgi:nitroreductase|nr:hypothetical protein [Solirubrobacteraceae bacterium]